MYDKLIQYINGILATTLSDEEVAVLQHSFVPKKLRKHQYLLEEGEVCKLAGFVNKGALKMYTIDENGKENVLAFCIENWWAGDRESFVMGTPSPYFIDAVEDSELMVVTNEHYVNHLSKQPFMTELIRIITERQANQLLKRVHATKVLSAEQRLADLEQRYPEFLQRFPQHLVASYLGMTKETLSRIRSNALKK